LFAWLLDDGTRLGCQDSEERSADRVVLQAITARVPGFPSPYRFKLSVLPLRGLEARETLAGTARGRKEDFLPLVQ
jgi:hypothetical protein